MKTKWRNNILLKWREKSSPFFVSERRINNKHKTCTSPMIFQRTLPCS